MPAAKVYIASNYQDIGFRDQVAGVMAAGGDPIAVSFSRALPNKWDNAVVLFLTTKAAFADGELAQFGRDVAAAGIPLVPVVDDLRSFSFQSIPAGLEFLSARNARGLQPGDGASIVESVRQWLGFAAANRLRKVFISYRRADSQAAAEQIETYLWSKKCQVFLDTVQIDGGEPVQEVIEEALHDMDFVLFLDSGGVAGSRWIIEELNVALTHRIPVAVVRMDPPQQYISLLGSVPAVDWDASQPDRCEKVFRLVSRGIGQRSSLDHRMERLLLEVSRLRNFTLTKSETRRYQLTRDARSFRIEYEDAGVTLERLHRLFSWYEVPPPCEAAIFVSGDYSVLPVTRAALNWAKSTNSLNAMSVQELVDLLLSL